MEELTKKEAVRLFRKQWSQKPHNEEEKEKFFDKKRFEKYFGDANPWPSCWLCSWVYRDDLYEYKLIRGIGDDCKYCPIDWGDGKSCIDRGTLFDLWVYSTSYSTDLNIKAELANLISNLPEKRKEE